MASKQKEKKTEHARASPRAERKGIVYHLFKKIPSVNTFPIYVALVIMFALYFLFEKSFSLALILGALIFFTIIILLIIEISNGIKEEGLAKNVVEIGAAVVLVLILWFGLQFVLHTGYPLDVVPSCSMLPVLQRGDMILLHGANQTTLRAPIVNITTAEWNETFSADHTQSAQCVAYNNSSPGKVVVSQTMRSGDHIGLLVTNGSSQVIIPYQDEHNYTVKYICGTANVLLENKSIVQEAYTTGIVVGNTTIMGDKNNSIVVYQTTPQDLFYREGDSYIVHRVYAILNVSGTYYTLTKGDNNPGLDIQYSNRPANMSQVGGEVIGSVPYLGYLKLILSNSFSEPAGCNTTVIQPS